MPDVSIRGAGTYTAHLNADNPVGTMQIIEHTLLALVCTAKEEGEQLQRLEETLNDYQAEAPALRARGAAQGIAGAPEQGALTP